MDHTSWKPPWRRPCKILEFLPRQRQIPSGMIQRSFVLLGSLLALSALFFTGVQGQEVRRALPAGSSLDERARFLAGLPVAPESELAPLQARGFYLDHLRSYNTTWQRFAGEHFLPKRQWAMEEMAPRAPVSRVLYYLFSGPDFINATALFPWVDTFILVALEAPGQVPAPELLSDEQLEAALANLRKSTETTLNFSYFITKDMRVDLEQSEFRGTLPILYAFAALAGYRVLTTEPVHIDQNGKMIDGTGHNLPGWRIGLRDPATGRNKTLFYLRGDLSNSGLGGGSSGLLKWLQSQPKGAAYLKAASYLLHESFFSTCRNFLLSHCTSILQDDSGIPLRFFSPEDWQLTFFGVYDRPIELFASKLQPELRHAYETASPVHPLPFGTGYNWRSGESNLLLAVRRDAATAPREQPGGGPPSAFPPAPGNQPSPPAQAPVPGRPLVPPMAPRALPVEPSPNPFPTPAEPAPESNPNLWIQPPPAAPAAPAGPANPD
jgi:hypothetical protein